MASAKLSKAAYIPKARANENITKKLFNVRMTFGGKIINCQPALSLIAHQANRPYCLSMANRPHPSSQATHR